MKDIEETAEYYVRPLTDPGAWRRPLKMILWILGWAGFWVFVVWRIHR